MKLEQELKRLKTEDRPHILSEIKRARQMGDLSENAEYHAAKEAQTHIERKIAELEDKLSRVRSFDSDNIPSDKAYIFARVRVRDLRSGEEIEYSWCRPRRLMLTMILSRLNLRLAPVCWGKRSAISWR